MIADSVSRSITFLDKGLAKVAPDGVQSRAHFSSWLKEKAAAWAWTNAEAFHRLGQHQLEQDQYVAAAKSLEKAVDLGYTEKSIFHHLGLAYAKSNQPERAERAFQKQVEINPQASWSYLELGEIYFNQLMLDQAYACFEKVHQSDPNNFWIGEWLSFSKHASKLVEKGELMVELIEQNPMKLDLYRDVTHKHMLPFVATEKILEGSREPSWRSQKFPRLGACWGGY
ncbi:MAG: tetratricopeptide repeat protein [Chloroflexota bacterium]